MLAELEEARPELSPSKRQLIGVSGGRDSVALLHFLSTAGYRNLVACHLNHKLRGRESDEDETFVKTLARQLGCKLITARKDISSEAARKKKSTETTAREARHDFFAEAARRNECRVVFLAHHADDLAETILHNLLRGASLSGAAAMKTISELENGLILARPLLHVTRSEIDEYIAVNGLEFREDSSNQSAEHTRNRVRHELLPLMNEIFQRDTSRSLVRFGKLAARDASCLDEIALTKLSELHLIEDDVSFALNSDFKNLHPALQSRMIFHWLTAVHKVGDIGGSDIENALSMLAPDGPAKINLARGLHLRRKARRLFIEVKEK